MTTNRQAASTAGGSAKRSVKSCALPRSRIRSACRSTSAKAPRRGSLMPRGLSMGTTGTPSAASSCFSSARSPAWQSCGPASTSGRCASARAARTVAAAACVSSCGLGSKAAASGQSEGRSSTLSSSRSNGRLRCTGPGRPERAMRTASASSVPSVAAERATHDALVTGAAISAWRSSWKAPRPTSLSPACPDSSTSGDSPACAVHSAAAALVKPAPPLTHTMPHWPVRRPHASAMCTAAASWRTWISLRRVPIAASNSGMMWLPDSVKMVVRPAASSVRATMSAPLMWGAKC